MRNALNTLESKFELHLDRYCLAMERGDVEEAEEASEQADDFLEAIGILKLMSAADRLDRVASSDTRAVA